MADDTDDDVTYQWRVVWFPPDAPTTVRTVDSEEKAKVVAAAVEAFAPLIERREVGSWEVTWSSVQ